MLLVKQGISQCYVTVTGDTVLNKTCKYAVENVVWKDFVSCTAVNNNLSRTGGSGWNGDAISVNQVYNNGFVETVVIENNRARMIGLNAVNSNSSYTDIDYSFYLRTDGRLYIYENGASRGEFGRYSSGDTIRLSVVNNVIYYVHNSSVVYISSVVPTLPMFVDAALNTASATSGPVVVGNSIDSLFNVQEATPGAGPVYQWKKNGGNVGAGGTSYTENLADGDVLTCELTPGGGGCAVGAQASNSVAIMALPIERDIPHHISADSVVEGSCLYFTEDIVWEVKTAGVTASGNTITNDGSTSWEMGATSANTVYDGGFMQTIVGETNRSRMIGLNSDHSSWHFNDIDYALYLVNNGGLYVYENGGFVGNFSTYTTGDTLQVAVVNNQIRYIQNGNTIYTSTVAPTFPLKVEASFNQAGGTFQNITVSNPGYRRFRANISGIANVNYQWKLNGADVGTNSSTYTDLTVSSGDTIQCMYYVSGLDCGTDTSFLSNLLIVQDFTPQVLFSIRNDSLVQNTCLFATEEVAFQSVAGLTQVGNNVTKTAGSNGWNAGAFSFNKVDNGGFMQTIVNETNTNRMIGLTSSNVGVSYTDIEYGIYLQSNGLIQIYESGAFRGNWGGYTTGDTLRVLISGTEVRYIKNGSVIYTSLVPATPPLYVDMSLNTVGSTIQKLTVFNGLQGKFASRVTGTSNVTYQWKLNGTDIPGATSATYVNDTLQDLDTITCDLAIVGTFDCSGDTAVVSNRIIINKENLIGSVLFSIRNDSVARKTCLFASEEVAWQSLSGLTTSGGTNNVSKTSGVNGWNAGGFSYNKVDSGGFMQFIISERTNNKMIGLNNTNTTVSYTDIDYAFYLVNNGTMRIYENGSNRGDWGAYNIGDTLRILVVGNEVRYIQNSSVVYTSTIAPTLPLYVDMSFNGVGSAVDKITVYNGLYGRFSSFVSGADSVSYQWKLNGANVGTDTSVYTNLTLVNNDTISCQMAVLGTSGCANDTGLISNNIVVQYVSLLESVLFSIRNDSIVQKSCVYAKEDVAWQASTGLSYNGSNNVTKTGAAGWNAGAFSYNKVDSGGFMQTIVNETNTNRMFGLNSTNTNVSYTDIDYAFYLISNGTMEIRENGVSKGNWGAYSTGDTLRVLVVDDEVRYIQNGSVVYTSLIAPTYPLYVDMSLNTTGATVEKITVYNGAYGRYSAFVSGTDNVSYQWKVNGMNVGTDTSVYTDLTLTANDTVSCVLSLNGTLGCAPDTVLYSNNILIQQESLLTSVLFSIRNDSIIQKSCLFANEQVAWQSISGLNLSGSNNVTKVSANGWNSGGFSYNQVGDGGFMQTIVDETNTSRMIGLNGTNVNVSYTDIDYAFYLQNNGNLGIYENGSNRGNWGSYSTGDTLRILVVGTEVRYIQNGGVVYTSTIAATPPMYVDMSLNHTGATLKNITVYNGAYGRYSAYVTGVSDVSYEWKLNGVIVGSDTAIYTNLSLNDGDSLACTLSVLGTSGCAPDTAVYSNVIEIKQESLVNSILYSIRNDSLVRYSCLFATEQVAWQSISGLDVVTSNNVTKSSGSNSWNAGGFSYNKVDSGGFMQTVVVETNTNRMIGLNATNGSVNYNEIDFAFYLQANGNLGVYENGSGRGNYGTYFAGDTLRVAVVDGVVLYIRNGNVLYTSAIVPSLPLYVDMSLNTVGSTLKNITVYNGLYGRFSANVSGASDVSYQWKLNGADVGTDTAVYDNTGVVDGDVITSILSIIGTSGCQPDTFVVSNTITIVEESLADLMTFYVTKESTERNGCQFAEETVSWTDDNTVVDNGTTLTKTQGGSASWNAAAFSYNTIRTNGYMRFVVNETTGAKMIGLNAVNTTNAWTDIDYAFYLVAGGALRIYESNSYIGAFGNYSVNDTLMIAVAGNVVSYYQNGQVIYTSASAPVLPLYADVSFLTQGGILPPIQMGNATNGVFEVVSEKVGNNPVYQWKLNGVNVGPNSSTYTNDTLKADDVVSCEITTDWINCSLTNFVSKSMTIKDNPPKNYIPVFTPVSTTWLGINSNWYDPVNWTAGVPKSGNNGIIPTGLGNYPTIPNQAYVYGLDIQNGATATLSGSAHLNVYDEWINDGAFTPATGMLEFKSCIDTSRWNSTSSATYYRMKVNNPKGLIISQGNMHIADSAYFFDGIVYNDSNEIVFEDNAGWSLASDTSFVDGEVQKIGDDAFTFPVGASGWLRPISIGAPSVNTDAFTARYYKNSPGTLYDITKKDPSMYRISLCEYWILNRDVGASGTNVSLTWRDTTSCGVTSPSDLKVARWSGTLWKDHENTGTVGTNDSGSVTSNFVTNFSPFTLASALSEENPLPVSLVSFTGTKSIDGVKLIWTTNSEINNDYFTIERSFDGIAWEKVAVVEGAGNSTSALNYTEFDMESFKGIAYYRLKQTDYDGYTEVFNTITVDNSSKKVNDCFFYPNPLILGESLKMTHTFRGENQSILIVVRDVNFKEIGSQKFMNQSSGGIIEIDLLRNVTRGVYYLEVISDNNKVYQQIVVQ